VFIAGMIIKATGSPAAIFITFGVFGLACAVLWWLYARRLTDPTPTELQAQSEEAGPRRSGGGAVDQAADHQVAVAALYRLFRAALFAITSSSPGCRSI